MVTNAAPEETVRYENAGFRLVFRGLGLKEVEIKGSMGVGEERQ